MKTIETLRREQIIADVELLRTMIGSLTIYDAELALMIRQALTRIERDARGMTALELKRFKQRGQ